ncbi:MAG: MBL fold metallo-hydrolase, partial [candidate division WOR-3 bacterium]
MFSSQQRWLLFIVCWIVIFCQVSFSENLKNQPLRIYQIDVNTGDAALIVSPTNKYVLIDAGDDRYNYGDTVLRFLRALGITHLDYLIVSHYHEDHIGGVPWVIYGLSGFGSNDSILNYCYDRGDTYTTSMYLNYVNAAGTKRRTVALGETLDLGGGVLMICVAKNGKVLSGDSVLPNSGENYRSLAWVLKFGLFKFFTGGDLVGYNVTGERDVETILAPVVRKVDVMKVNHHGSRNSSNNIFLDSLRPKAAVISQGTHPVNNNHPHQEAIDRLVAHNTYIYQMNDNPTGGTIPNGYGRILNTTATITVNQASFIINGDEYLLD